jgi:hypothetical protein
MMELTPIVLTASVITIILQIVLLIVILDTKKKARGASHEKVVPHDLKDVKRPREMENKFVRRPPHDQKIKVATAQAQDAEPVERSLREINLRLKNAERDQEKERRRIKDTIAPAANKRFDSSRPPRERDEGFRRNDRPRHDFHQHRNADVPRTGREERATANPPAEPRENRPPVVQQTAVPSMPPPVEKREAAPAPAQPRVAPAAGQYVPPPAAPAAGQHVPPPPAGQYVPPPAASDAAQPVSETGEGLQHGRKTIVKRRILNLEEEKAAHAGEETAAPASDTTASGSTVPLFASPEEAQEAKPSVAFPEVKPTGESEGVNPETISFGR